MKMANITGVVTAMSSKEVNTKWGMKPTYSFQVDGTWFKTGFKKGKMNKGDNIQFSYTEGAYGNDVDVGSITVVGADAAPAASSSPQRATSPTYGSKGVFPIPPLDGQRAIVRQNALTNARELYVNCPNTTTIAGSLEDAAYKIINIARVFESYACGDLDTLKAIEMKARLAAAPSIAEVTGE
jgi:hypothetical protein